MVKKLVPLKVILLVLVFASSGSAFNQGIEDLTQQGILQVSFIYVGQGDAILLRDSTGFTVLIDGGPVAAGQTVLAYLRPQGVTNIDVVMASHPNGGHAGGLLAVLNAPDISIQQVL